MSEPHAPIPFAERLPQLAPFLDRAGRFKQWPKKRHLQLVALTELAERFEPGVRYSERQVNAILLDWHTFADWTRLRRDLVDYGLLERTSDGSAYWRVPGDPAAVEPLAG